MSGKFKFPCCSAKDGLSIDVAAIGRALFASSTKRYFIGFDAFTDSICSAIDQRLDQTHFKRFESLKSFGRAIESASDLSANFELMLLEKRIGGNAANLARALCNWGQKVHLASTMGEVGKPEPLFAKLTEDCQEVFLLGPSGATDAVEFSDGKLLLGKMNGLKDLSVEKIVKSIGKNKLIEQLQKCDLFASLNWTMFHQSTALWKWLRLHCFLPMTDKKRIFFVDLSDPRKRSLSDLQEALLELSNWQAQFDVILSLNVAESIQIAKALNLKELETQSSLGKRQKRCEEIWRLLGIKAVVIHGADFAISHADRQSFSVLTPHCKKPKISTGGGDHFNAGLCRALLSRLNWPEALALANATSSCFVRSGNCPTLSELNSFLFKWQTGSENQISN